MFHKSILDSDLYKFTMRNFILKKHPCVSGCWG